jgi:hypothetical protein
MIWPRASLPVCAPVRSSNDVLRGHRGLSQPILRRLLGTDPASLRNLLMPTRRQGPKSSLPAGAEAILGRDDSADGLIATAYCRARTQP